jgi:dTDP-4-amino-4,6-dideoxygalactose transaminase
VEEAEIIREKGTNRTKFIQGKIDKYTWINFGSSYLPSDMNAAYLYAQLEIADEINNARLAIWNRYYESLKPLADAGKIELAYVPKECVHNGHMFWLKVADAKERKAFMDEYLKAQNGIYAVSHYVPLHTAPAGQKFGRFHGEDKYTTKESERLVRLPMYYGLTMDQVDYICDKVKEFF